MPGPGPEFQPNTRAGSLIRGGAITTCLRCWRQDGRRRASWHKVRRVIRELFPTAKYNSIDAVIRGAQAVAAVAREQAKRDPNWIPPDRIIPDFRRLIRAATRR